MEDMRLQKYMAHCGVASRRACEEIIAAGRVYVNGKQTTDPATKITRKDEVKVDGKKITVTRTYTYLIMNKPLSVLSTVSDDRGRKTVMDFIDRDARLYPVGRLDFDTQGIILLTDDGDFTQRITHPKNEMTKTYEATIKGDVDEEILAKIREGVVLDDGEKTLPAKADVVRYSGKNAIVRIVIREGKNREVRRIFDAVEHPVLKLKRVAIGGLVLPKDLRPGMSRDMKRQDFVDLFGKAEAKKLGYYN